MEKDRRKRLASLPFSEKLKILEKLRDRSRAIAASGLRKTHGHPEPRPASGSTGPANRERLNGYETKTVNEERGIEFRLP